MEVSWGEPTGQRRVGKLHTDKEGMEGVQGEDTQEREKSWD